MRIPKTFRLNGKEYKIKRENMDKEDLWGQCASADLRIRLSDSKSLPKHRVGQIFLHELTHAIGNHMGEKFDERFVEGFSMLLDEYERTKKF